MERKKRYREDFLAWIEKKCEESGDVRPVDNEYYESFVALTDKELTFILRGILQAIAGVFNKKLVSNAWKTDDEMYEFVMVYLELIAEGKLAVDLETGKMLFLKPVGEPPSDVMWDRIQKRITSSQPAIRAAIKRNVQGSGGGS